MKFLILSVTSILAVMLLMIGLTSAQNQNFTQNASNVFTSINNLSGNSVSNVNSDKGICNGSTTFMLPPGRSVKCDKITITLEKLVKNSSNGSSPSAVFYVYYKNKFVNMTQVNAFGSEKFSVDGRTIYIHVNQTLDGTKRNRWAQMNVTVTKS